MFHDEVLRYPIAREMHVRWRGEELDRAATACAAFLVADHLKSSQAALSRYLRFAFGLAAVRREGFGGELIPFAPGSGASRLKFTRA
jgi:hypothetical protein